MEVWKERQLDNRIGLSLAVYAVCAVCAVCAVGIGNDAESDAEQADGGVIFEERRNRCMKQAQRRLCDVFRRVGSPGESALAGDLMEVRPLDLDMHGLPYHLLSAGVGGDPLGKALNLFGGALDIGNVALISLFA